MIVKILHSDGNSWWLYDNLEKIRFGIRGGEYVLASGKVGDSSEGDAEYDFGIFYVGDMRKEDIVNLDYLWARSNKPDMCPDVSIIDFNEIDQEGVNFIHWVIARNRNNEEKFIVFNTLGFLLNDEGKTIEKI